jgi:hypothetical protein
VEAALETSATSAARVEAALEALQAGMRDPHIEPNVRAALASLEAIGMPPLALAVSLVGSGGCAWVERGVGAPPTSSGEGEDACVARWVRAVTCILAARLVAYWKACSSSAPSAAAAAAARGRRVCSAGGAELLLEACACTGGLIMQTEIAAVLHVS